ncbi:MAG TPA: LCP family protein [Thermomicrobiales bacterium]|jgi:LCP family protein required for cell wall assembly|nr:LCP family protein [Thermomicrobiales bacterium]
MNNGAQPTMPERKPYPAAPAETETIHARRRAGWSRRRKIVVALAAILLLTPLLVAGWYTWKIASAIDDVQGVAVVDLPERSGSVDGTTGDQQPIAGTPGASASPTARASSNDPSSFDVARGLIGTGTGVNPKTPGEVWHDKQYLNILVLGVDTRADGGDQNADVIILARLDLKAKTLHSVSIPRDLLVEIPGHGPGKINGAYNVGVSEQPNSKIAGVAKMRDTVEYNFGFLVDDYVMIDFQGFEKVVDSIGGIDINVPEAIHDTEYPTEDYGVTTLDIAAGPQHMDGETALAYARTRHGDSDDARRDRQILVIQSLFNEGKQIGSITKIANLIVALGGAAKTSFHFDEQLALASIALNMEESQIDMTSISQPMIQPGTAADGAWVYIGDLQEISAFIEATLAGDGASTETLPAGS